MIQLILKSYFTTLFAVSASCVSVFILGIYYILRKNMQEVREASRPGSLVAALTVREETTDNDIQAIAGDDVLATQLDLARAFIEAGKQQVARPILQSILKEGSEVQQAEARTLMAQI